MNFPTSFFPKDFIDSSLKYFLKNWKQRVEIINNFSATKEAIARIPQGFIDGPLLLNLFTNYAE